MSLHAQFRDRVAYERRQADGTYPGLEQYAPPAQVAARDAGRSMVRMGGDVVLRRVWWLLPDVPVRPGDRLDGATVTEHAGEAKDGTGRVLYQVVYGED
jgi:hypothetical protein